MTNEEYDEMIRVLAPLEDQPLVVVCRDRESAEALAAMYPDEVIQIWTRPESVSV